MKIVHPTLNRVMPKPWQLRSSHLPEPRTHSQFQFTRIVDTQTPIPGCPGFFSRLGLGAATAGRTVFWGSNEYGYSGIYHADDSGLKVVIDSQKCVPDRFHRFSSFGSAPEFDGDRIVFLAQDDTAQLRLYQDTHYRLTPLVETEQQILGDRFINLGNPAACQGYIAFLARLESTGHKGLFLYAPQPQLLQSQLPQPPALHPQSPAHPVVGIAYQRLAGPFLQDLTEPDVDQNGTVVFRGQDREHRMGIYRYAHQQVTCMANTHTPIPGGMGPFSSFSNPTIDGDIITFLGRGRLMQQGLYQMGPNGIQSVVDVHTRMPASLEPFARFQTFAVHGSRIAFLAGAEGGCFGLFLAEAGQISKVIELGDRLDDATVVGLHLGRQSLYDGGIIFKVQFQDGTQGIFRAEG